MEIARRLARLADAPFIKVEATKFTSVDYVVRDVDTIIRDLAEAAIKQTREAEARKVRDRAADAAEERILDVLLPPSREVNFQDMKPTDSATRQKFRKMLREGRLDDKEIEVEVSLLPAQLEIMAPPGMEDLTSQLQGMFQQMGGARRKLRKMTVVDALKTLTEEEAAKLLNDDEIKLKALTAVEQNGIVFLDEIDKITSRQETQGADVSRQGVQRDLLPNTEWSARITSSSSRRAPSISRSPPTSSRNCRGDSRYASSSRRCRLPISSRFSPRRKRASSASTRRSSARRTFISTIDRMASGGSPRSRSR